MIDQLPLPGRRKLAVDSIRLCLAYFRPPFEEMFSLPTVNSVCQSLEFLRTEFQANSHNLVPEEFFNEVWSLKDCGQPYWISSIVRAISACADYVGRREFPTSSVREIMSSCYEAVSNSEGISDLTMDEEPQRENLVQLLDAQRKLIEEIGRERRL